MYNLLLCTVNFCWNCERIQDEIDNDLIGHERSNFGTFIENLSDDEYVDGYYAGHQISNL